MIIEKAAEVLEKHKLCNHCIGRGFAKLGKGSNEERGRAIRFVLNMERALEEKKPLKEEECEICGGIFDRLEDYALLCIDKAKMLEFETFLVGSSFPEEILNREKEIFEKFGLYWEPINREFNREVGKILERKLNKKVNRKNPDVKFIIDPYKEKVRIEIKPVYVYGRYRKLVRGMPQTPLKGYGESVASIICKPFGNAFKGKAVFHGAGREDIDVRMLGNGRPFFVEIKRAKKRHANLEKIAEEIGKSGKIEVFDLRFATREEMERLLSERHDKEYEALVYVEEGVNGADLRKIVQRLGGAEIVQKTPQRVLKRRSDLTRVRKVYKVSGKVIDGKHLKLRIFCEGGLYIKELISGDMGRTTPSVSEIIGKSAVCEALDVVNVEVIEDGSKGTHTKEENQR